VAEPTGNALTGIQFVLPSGLTIAKAGELFAMTVQKPDLGTALVKQQYIFGTQT